MSNLLRINPKFLKAAVYGANDGIITTFAVVAGVAGAKLPAQIILILGIANMIADGVSMAVGDYLGEHSEQRLRKQQRRTHEEEGIWKTGLVTFVSFVIAGSLPLLPYIIAWFAETTGNMFLSSIAATAGALFLVGSLRTFLTKGSWLKNGLEMLGIGAIAATLAYVLGAWIERIVL
jgi:vacuolar iron transporter family protein